MATPRSGQGSNLAVFESYFIRADLDRDGRINGNEAIAFFQGANLPNLVLAKIWAYADQKQSGFLGREEFYNALRLVTVAQSGRELTPEIVQAALKGPAASAIPPPKITLPPNPSPQMNFPSTPIGLTQAQAGVPRPNNLQNPSFAGQQVLPNAVMNQQSFPSANQMTIPPQARPSANQMMMPPQARPSANQMMIPTQAKPSAASVSLQGVDYTPPVVGGTSGPRLPSSNAPNISTDWFSSRTSGSALQGNPQAPVRGAAPLGQDSFGFPSAGSAAVVNSKLQTPTSPLPLVAQTREASFSSMQQDSKALVLAGNGFSSESSFGGDPFSRTGLIKQETTSSSLTASSTMNSSNFLATSGSQAPSKPAQVDLMQSTPLPSNGNQLQQSQTLVKQNQLDVTQTRSIVPVSNAGNSGLASSQSQIPWPNFTQTDIQKYIGIFVKVDRDRDGKITGLEARNLFLSWNLPKDALKKIWDLCDLDNDGMLSLREFCIALYLMQKIREGRSLPDILPDSVKADQTLLHLTSQSMTGSNASIFQPTAVQGISGPRPPLPSSFAKPPLPTQKASHSDDTQQPAEKKTRVPVLEKNFVDQLSKEEQTALQSKFQEASDADKKVHELDKEILESKEKIEFYRTKMQELVLYKSRCDNRLNEVIERTSAEKREAESLAKKYEEKYKQSGDVASRLTIEEATFRDIQERKLELYNTIIKMEQGGNTDGSLQERADKIRYDLEEITKAMTERCKQYGLRAKPTTLLELPFGWQLGIQEGAANWDEEWDKFESDDFTIIKELTIEMDMSAPAKADPAKAEPAKADSAKADPAKVDSSSPQGDEIPKDEASKVASSSIGEKTTEEPPADKQKVENGSVPAHNEDGSTKSPPGTAGRNVPEYPSEGLNLSQSAVLDTSPTANESDSDHGGAESSSRDKLAATWGPTFDHGDDTDSLWSYNTKDNDDHNRRQTFSSGSEDFDLFPPIKTDSPSAASMMGKEKSPFFDSVPSTPMFSSGFSPRFSEGPEDHAFDSFSQPNFFGTNDGGSFPSRDTFSRFDSFRSTADYGIGESLTSFDSARSTADYGRGETLTRFDSMSSTADYGRADTLTRFDSMRSTSDYSKSFFDEADFFGSGPFKSSDNQSPKKGSLNWDAF